MSANVGRRRGIILGTGATHLGRSVITAVTVGWAVVTAIAIRRTVVTAVTAVAVRGAGLAAVTVVLLAQGGETLLLGEGVDVSANDKGDQVEEGNPELVREELLGKGQADGRGEPRDAHDSPEADLDGGANLVERTSAGNESHGDQVDAVLDRRNLSMNELA